MSRDVAKLLFAKYLGMVHLCDTASGVYLHKQAWF
jgi:hypothetical protein